MGQVVQMPFTSETNRYGCRLQTQGDAWIHREKKLVDKAEFLEAMILVLDDVRLQNIKNRDFAMMEIVTEEIPMYQKRLEEVQRSLASLRVDFDSQVKQVAN